MQGLQEEERLRRERDGSQDDTHDTFFEKELNYNDTPRDKKLHQQTCDIQNLKNELKVVEKDRDEVKKINKKKSSEINKLREEIEKKDEEIEKKDEEIEKKDKEISELKEQLKTLDKGAK